MLVINETVKATTITIQPGQCAVVLQFSRAKALGAPKKQKDGSLKDAKLLDHGQTHGFQYIDGSDGQRYRVSAFVGQYPEDVKHQAPKPPTK